MEKQRRKASYKPFSAKIMLFGMLILMSISLISAFEFDNVGNYNEETKTMEIINAFGLGDTIARVTLGSELNVKVIPGEERLVAWYTIENLQEYDGDEVFDVIDTYDIKNGMKPLGRNFKFKKQQINYVEVQDYEQVCGIDDGFGVLGCIQVPNGTKMEKRIEWKAFNKNDLLTPGDYTIGLFTEVKSDDYVEWIPTMYGIEIVEWAEWTASLNDEIIHYWKNDESSGTVVEDSAGVNENVQLNGTANNGGGWVSGLIGNAIGNYSNNRGGWYMNGMGGNQDIDLADFTINFWAYPHSDQTGTANPVMINRNNNDFKVQKIDGSEAIRFYSSGTFTDGGTLNLDDWNMITVIDNGTGTFLYLNGTRVTARAGSDIPSMQDFSFCFSNSFADYDLEGACDEIGIWNRTLTNEEITQLFNNGAGIQYTTTFAVPSNVTLVSPDDYLNSTNKAVTFNCTIEDDVGALNLTLLIDGTYNTTITNSSPAETDLYLQQELTLSEGTHTWSCNGSDADGEYNTTTRNLNVDSLVPSIFVASPSGYLTTGDLTINETLNWTVNDTNLDIVWWDYNGVNTTLAQHSNLTNFTLAANTSAWWEGRLWANDTFGNEDNYFTNWTYQIFINNQTFNTTTYETETESYIINITANSTLSSVNFTLDGIEYTTQKSGTLYTFVMNDTPLGVENRTSNWNFTYAGASSNTSITNISVAETNFSLCGETGGSTVFANFSYADEADLSKINNGTIPLLTLRYWLGTGALNKSFTFTNNTANPEYTFCALPPDRDLDVSFILQYADADGNYPQRIFQDTTTIDNTTSNVTLYLLKTADGQQVTFQVVNQAEQALANVHVIANRTISGTSVVVGEGDTDAAGGIAFFLNPNFLHTFNFTATGLTPIITSLFPTQTAYTITMGNVSAPTTDFNQGINLVVAPTNATLPNQTAVNFSLVLSSTFNTVTEFGFVLSNSTDDLASANKSTNGGTVSSVVNTINYSQVTMDYYWIINNTRTNGSRSWFVISSAGTDWSLRVFFTDLINYTSEGIFGLDNFGLALITFIFIFVFVGIMSFKFGLVSSAAISSLIFSLVLFLDVGLGLMDNFNPVGAVAHFPLIFIGLIMLGLWIRESIK